MLVASVRIAHDFLPVPVAVPHVEVGPMIEDQHGLQFARQEDPEKSTIQIHTALSLLLASALVACSMDLCSSEHDTFSNNRVTCCQHAAWLAYLKVVMIFESGIIFILPCPCRKALWKRGNMHCVEQRGRLRRAIARSRRKSGTC